MEEYQRQHRRPVERIGDEGGFKQLRFWLNVLFMAGAVAGMALFYTKHHDLAVYILLGAAVPKFIEVTLRIMKL